MICGDESESRKIKSYNLQTGRVINYVCSKDAFGLAEVEFDGKVALATSRV